MFNNEMENDISIRMSNALGKQEGYMRTLPTRQPDELMHQLMQACTEYLHIRA